MVRDREKHQFRENLLRQLLSLTQGEIKRRSKDVEKKLSSLSIYKEAKKVLVYYPLKGEVDILEMIRKDFTKKQFSFPVMDLKTKNLRLFEVAQLDEDFKVGPLGVMEPDTKRAKEVDISEIDIAVIPGLAFDQQRNRLGRGGGFYDRFLKRLAPPTLKVGIAFECQILKRLPINLALDQKVDIVVSEKTII